MTTREDAALALAAELERVAPLLESASSSQSQAIGYDCETPR